MQVTELESKGLKRNYRITVDATEINEQMERELRAAGEQVKIPGFRPGFIPMKVLQQRYGKSVQPEVLKQVINRASTNAIRERKLKPALTPSVNIEDYKEGGALVFTIEFENFPEVPEIAFDGVKLERKTFEIAEKDIDDAVERIASRAPKLNALEDAKAKEGHVVNIDFKGMIDGVAFEGGSATNFRLELGGGQFIEGFEEQLIGVKAGDDKIVKVTFPKDYPGAEIAGKEASFAVKVHEVLEKETPEVDEAFAKARGFADVRALREAVRNQMIREYDQIVRGQLKKQLFDWLEEKYDLDLPKGMVDLEFNTIWDRVKQAQAQGEESVAGKDDKELEKEYRPIAERRVKLGLMLAEIGNRNKIQIGREELSRAVMNQASMFPGQEKKVMEFYRNNPDRMDDLRGPILEEKAVDFILEKVKFEDAKVSLEELAMTQDDEEGGDKKSAKGKKSAKKK